VRGCNEENKNMSNKFKIKPSRRLPARRPVLAGALYLDQGEDPVACVQTQCEALRASVDLALGVFFDIVATPAQIESGAAYDAVDKTLEILHADLAAPGRTIIVGLTSDETRRPGRDMLLGRVPSGVLDQLSNTGEAVWAGVPVQLFTGTARELRSDEECGCDSDFAYGQCCEPRGFMWLLTPTGRYVRNQPMPDDLVRLIDAKFALYEHDHGKALRTTDAIFSRAEFEGTGVFELAIVAGVTPRTLYAMLKTKLFFPLTFDPTRPQSGRDAWAAALVEYDTRHEVARAALRSKSEKSKYAGFEELLRADASAVHVAAPWVLGDTYDEITEHLDRIAETGKTVVIVPPSQRSSHDEQKNAQKNEQKSEAP